MKCFVIVTRYVYLIKNTTMSAIAHCAVVRNPFSTAVTHAKLTDGAVSMSSSCRYSKSLEVKDFGGFVDILLFPGFTTPIFYRSAENSGATTVRKPAAPVWTVPSRSLVSNSSNPAAGEIVHTITAGGATPNQYRVVSQGLRISLINNSTDNDGWFEAIRITPSYSEVDMTINKLTESDPLYIGPNLTAFENGIMGTNDNPTGSTRVDLSMNPSYIAGKLRDIHKHTFILNRQENNDFIEIPRISTITCGGAGYRFGHTEPASGSISNNSSPMFYLDNHMDAILIRCRANASSTAALRMHLHVVQHVEECYDEASDIFRFQTSCPTNKRLLEANLNAMKKDIKPSIIRSPTLPVTSTSYSKYNKRRSVKRRRW